LQEFANKSTVQRLDKDDNQCCRYRGIIHKINGQWNWRKLISMQFDKCKPINFWSGHKCKNRDAVCNTGCSRRNKWTIR